jgi:tRNA(adenine34) deaminase
VNVNRERNEGEREIDVIDFAMMARCIELSKIGSAAGELPFGSLIARRGRIVAEATNEIERFTDESRHAEIVAIARARQLLADGELSECTLYSTVEPCPMCSFCIRAAGIGRVVFALGSPRLGGLSRWNILGDDRFPLLFGPVPDLVPGLLADDAHKAWIGVRPVAARAILWLGYLSKPESPAAGAPSRSRYRYSLRRFISMFLRQRKRGSSAAGAVSQPNLHTSSLETLRPHDEPTHGDGRKAPVKP